MRKKLLTGRSFILIVFILIVLKSSAQVTQKIAVKWVDKGEWKQGLKLKLHPSTNKTLFYAQYHQNPARWDKAFAFLRDSDLIKLKPGRYTIDGDNVYSTITESPSKKFDQSAWESHKNYIDLQYVIKGKERIGVAPVSSATVVKPYNPSTDSANYTADGEYYIAEPGIFFLFFPTDAHRPNIKVEGFDTVKKIVIKIKAG